MHAVAVGGGVLLRWIALYAPLSVVTWIWAGSDFSPGQGGGIAELAFWVVSFGLITAGAALERTANGPRVIAPRAVVIAGAIGQVIGSIAAVALFISRGGPGPGDWWIGPAAACLVALLWIHALAPRRREGTG